MEPPAPRSFLDLPDAIRRHIYSAAGLFVDSNIFLYHKRTLCFEHTDRFWTPYCSLAFSINLLLTSRAVHKEVSHILFSTNRFFVQDALVLLRFPVSALSSIPSLSIHLSYPKVYRRLQYGHPLYPRLDHDKGGPFISKDNILLKNWENAAKYIAPYVKPQALDFGLICYADSPETARLALHPLRHLPTLASCQIRLSDEPHIHELGDMAKEAVLRSIGPPKFPHEGFPFQRLPSELREMVLRYTDLVTPYNTVKWVCGKYYIKFRICDATCYTPDEKCHPNEHKHCVGIDHRQCVNPCQHRECVDCPHYGCQFVMGCHVRKVRRIGDLCHCPTGSFCSRSYTAYSVDCRCWRPPTPLFLVSKAFYAEAQAVFFSTNQFIVYDNHNPIRKHLEATFLGNTISDTALRSLRSLHVIVLANVYDKWMEVLRRVDGKLTNLQYLSIHFNGIDLPDWCGHNFTEALQGQSGETAIRTAKQLTSTLWPMKDIDSPRSVIRSFFVGISLLSGTFQYYKRREGIYLFRPWDDKERRYPKANFERKVCGDSAGDVGDSSSALESRGDVWVEGVFVFKDQLSNHLDCLLTFEINTAFTG
ncbi:uncharacterized protein F4812DRAFT_427168 [Daldinia caldariorum]|uniref:uncharacterized protein n=1 Tax=Daldinia caldariorum TaxID=326644 RepID=UPI002007C1C3|nr:uncharacterized protein F4812DRAFT_427168 [Daldinia caldariorum]KAI1468520.1 hypothetical protein F4812DRAFT_427168 [Daldinia caldariorum]